MRSVVLCVLLAVGLAGCGEDTPPLDKSAVARGEKVAVNCTPCHSLKSRAVNVGPPLNDVVGRKAGTSAGYDYSPEMKASGITWTPAELARFIQNPIDVVPGTKMALGPLTPQEASDVVTYLQSLSR
jgi:cytochrome c